MHEYLIEKVVNPILLNPGDGDILGASAKGAMPLTMYKVNETLINLENFIASIKDHAAKIDAEIIESESIARSGSDGNYKELIMNGLDGKEARNLAIYILAEYIVKKTPTLLGIADNFDSICKTFAIDEKDKKNIEDNLTELRKPGKIIKTTTANVVSGQENPGCCAIL